jgi:hypothetical protein
MQSTGAATAGFAACRRAVIEALVGITHSSAVDTPRSLDNAMHIMSLVSQVGFSIRLTFAAMLLALAGCTTNQVPSTTAHEHLTEVACVDVPAGERRPEFGCFNVGKVTGLEFSQPSVYWQASPHVWDQKGCGGG